MTHPVSTAQKAPKPSMDLQAQLFHVGYEWWMFKATHDILKSLETSSDPVRNALLESMALHGRALMDFFHKDPRDAYEDDITAWRIAPLLGHSPMPPALEPFKINTHKRIAHLTDVRAIPLTEWDVESVRRHLQQKFDELKRAVGTSFPHEWLGDAALTTSLLPGASALRTVPVGPRGPTGAENGLGSVSIGATGPNGPDCSTQGSTRK